MVGWNSRVASPHKAAHPALERQLRRLDLDPGSPPDTRTWAALLGRVSAAYDEADQDRYLARRALDVSQSEMRLLQISLAAERDQLQAILQSLALGLCVFDPAGRLTSLNPEAERITGWTQGEAAGRSVLDVFPAADGTGSGEDGPGLCGRELEGCLLEGRSVHDEDTVLRRRDGPEVPVSILANPIRHGGALLGTAVVIRDITRRKQAEAALRASEVRYRELMESAADAILVFDGSFTIREVNRRACELSGYERDELVGRNGMDLFAPADADAGPPEEQWLLEGAREARSVERAARRKDGSFILVETSTSVHGDGNYQVIIRDVTDQRRLEVELRHSQKLESVGRLAAGIAHEINTPIQFIGDNVSFVRESFGDIGQILTAVRHTLSALEEIGVDCDAVAELGRIVTDLDVDFLVDEIPSALDQTLDGVERVTTIVQATRAFGHPDGKHKASADLNMAIRDTLVVARNEYKYVADVDCDLGRLPPVVCNIGDVNQVVLNLVVNAAHAIAEILGAPAQGAGDGERGRITVRTAHDGEHVAVSVSDTGCGIPEGVQERVFEPFFTTKEVGKGTGQGLSLARTVADNHGGTLTFETETGRGTTFTLRLPVAGTDVAAHPAVADGHPGAP